MRLLLCANNLPPKCDTGSLERVNFHYAPKPWPARNSRAFTVKAFSNGVDPHAFNGPFCFDLEPSELWGEPGAEFTKWLNIHAGAIRHTRTLFPKNELLAYDPCGGATRVAAMRNVNMCSKMLLSLDGACVSTYANEDGSFTSTGEAADFTLVAYRELRKQTRRLDWQIGTCVTNRTRPGSRLIDLKVFRESVEWGRERDVDFIVFWQAEAFFGGGTEAQAAKRLQPYIDIIREFGQ